MKRIIISRTDRIGDVILTSAAFGPLRKTFPDASIRILVRPELVPLFANTPEIEAVPCPPGAGAKGFHRHRFREWRDYFRNNPADCIVFLHPDNDLQFAAAAAKIPRRLGYGKQLGRFALNESIPYTRHLGQKHEAVCNFDLLQKIGCALPDPIQPFLHVEDFQKDAGEITRKPYALFHPAAFGNKPRWSAQKYAELAEKLIQEFDWNLILIGSEPSPATAEAFLAHGIPDSKWEDRGGKDSLLETASLLKGAAMVVSRDSGPAHLAAAVGAPLVCLMGQCDPIHSPTRWAPIGPRARTIISDLPPQKGESRQDRWARCFDAISAEQVLSAIRELTR
ncbi:glycosyltransferase family 9 protein [Puniceicoccus vermicola]|uniref:Glycosyltransferase family 9 protein n=1 Tax=Puniceicoccus vermicola TaxID=388746 RepID=A0A7X1B0D4_9BACT|nr:glycosyltransferase family 9 protein [Puniceicoccus vermicola]MBC2603308.1 glycosyltransferase family 9 protein [Puniceicoccus vermicola]